MRTIEQAGDASVTPKTMEACSGVLLKQSLDENMELRIIEAAERKGIPLVQACERLLTYGNEKTKTNVAALLCNLAVASEERHKVRVRRVAILTVLTGWCIAL